MGGTSREVDVSTYFVTFRIADREVAGKSYQQRYDAMIAALRKEDIGFWSETTSFLLVESNLDTRAFTQRAAAALSADHDMLLAYDPEDKSSSYFGAVKELDVLKSFLPTTVRA